LKVSATGKLFLLRRRKSKNLEEKADVFGDRILMFYLTCISLATKSTSISVKESLILGGNHHCDARELTLVLGFSHGFK